MIEYDGVTIKKTMFQGQQALQILSGISTTTFKGERDSGHYRKYLPGINSHATKILCEPDTCK